MYAQHPYGHLSIGNDAALRRLTLGDVASFHAATFCPSRTTLVVTGALSHDELLRAAAPFGDWADASPEEPQRRAALSGFAEGSGETRQSSQSERRRFGAVDQAAADIEPSGMPALRLAIVPREAAAQSELRIGHLSARRNTPDYAALLVMNALLGGQFVSRINLKLREEKGYTYGARTGFDWRRGVSPFVMSASVHTAATADAIADSVAEIGGIRGSRPPGDEELALAKASLTRGYPRNFETAQQVARSVSQLALHDLPDSYFAEFVPKVNAIGRDEVTRAAERYLDPAKLTTLIVGDHTAIADSLATLELGDPSLLPIDL